MNSRLSARNYKMMHSNSFANEVLESLTNLAGDGVELTAETLEKINQSIENTIQRRRDTYAQRYPTATTIVAILGVILTYYAVEQIIDATWLANHPFIILAIGILFLIVTGR